MRTLQHFEIILVFIAGFYASFAYALECSSPYVKSGCCRKWGGTGKLDTLLLNERHTISWEAYHSWLKRFVCKCELKARSEGYRVFGVQYWGECWATKRSMAELSPETCNTDAVCKIQPKDGGDYRNCSDTDSFCTGTGKTTTVYTHAAFSPINGGYSPWSEWTECSKTCGGGGRTRERSCTNPKPANGGTDCSRLGEPEAWESCNTQACLPFSHPGCSNVLQSSSYYTLNASKTFSWGGGDFFCLALYPNEAASSYNYIVEVKFYSVSSSRGPLSGNPGLIFNVQDANNFQYFYLRLNDAHNCYVAGVYKNGNNDWSKYQSGKCSWISLTGMKWITLRIHVTPAGAAVYADNHHLATIPMILSMKGKGGVAVRNNENNIVRFKDYTIKTVTGL